MRLLKVRDMSTRPVTGYDIILNMIFGSGNGPSKFDPTKEYKLGDTVYVVNEDGTISIWICNSNGTFDEVGEPNWSEYNINTMLDRQISALMSKFGVQSGYTNEIYVEHQMWNTLTPPATSIDNLGLKAILGEYSYVEVYVDNLMVPNSVWSISDNGGITFDSEYVAGLSAGEHTVLVIAFEEKNVITKMIRREQVVLDVKPEALKNEDGTEGDPVEIVTIPYPITPDLLSINFDLYRDGVYIPSSMLTIKSIPQDDPLADPQFSLQINGLVSGDTEASHQYIFNFVYSVTNEVILLKDDYRTTIHNEDEAYMLTLYDVDFLNSYQQIKVYENNNIVNSRRYVLSRHHVNMVSVDDYYAVGTDIICPVWTYILPEYAVGEVPHNSQTFPVHVDDTLRIPIPYLHHDPVTSDYLLFNDGGILLSDTRWYVDGNYFQYFAHGVGLTAGERVDVRLIDSDSSVGMRSFYLTPTEDDQKVYTSTEDLTKYALVMLFTVSGMYICKDRYAITTTGITFGDDWSLYLNEGRIEVIAFKYLDDYTKTCFDVATLYAASDEQTVVGNPFSDYNASTDSLLLFNNNGLYIGQHFYRITESGDIELFGEPLWEGNYLEVVLVRNLSTSISSGGKR